MFFNSIDFAIFLPVVFALYWLANNNLKLQNFLIFTASYIFYGWWDWRFLLLIIFSTIVDYTVGQGLKNEKTERKRQILLWTSIIVNIGFLGFFKYYNFFVENFISAFSLFGNNISINTLNIILPVGISFYTFQTMSYTIDIYREKIKPTSDFVAFAAFISFFPQLVAGPIERASNLLPQFCSKRQFRYSEAVAGMRQILWGLFKKIVIADNCAEYVNLIFNGVGEYSGTTLLIGAIFFAFQIYGDFSGYSDIAIGCAKLFGIHLKQNFAYPYFSRDIAEFWRRWHISLSTWFRDYLYIPLGGSRVSTLLNIRNVFIIFLVSGFWHGANWTFVFWGALNAIYFLPLLLMKKNRNNIDIVAKGKLFPSIKEFFSILLTFGLTTFAWIFFRAETLPKAIQYVQNLFLGLALPQTYFQTLHFLEIKTGYIFLMILLLFIIVEWMGREEQFAIAKVGLKWHRLMRYSLYYVIIITIFWYSGKEQQFIYFQF